MPGSACSCVPPCGPPGATTALDGTARAEGSERRARLRRRRLRTEVEHQRSPADQSRAKSLDRARSACELARQRSPWGQSRANSPSAVCCALGSAPPAPPFRAIATFYSVDFDLPADDAPDGSRCVTWLAANPKPTGRAARRGRATSRRTGRGRGGSTPTRSTSSSSTTSCGGRGRAARRTRSASAGPGRRSSTPAPTSRRSATSSRCSRARRSGASCSASPAPAATSPTSATRAVRDGDEWVVNGQKIWTSLAPVLASSASSSPAPTPTSPKHQGISYFICPMDTPGIEIRPIIEMTGGHTVQRGVLHRRAPPGREPRRRRRTRAGRWPR